MLYFLLICITKAKSTRCVCERDVFATCLWEACQQDVFTTALCKPGEQVGTTVLFYQASARLALSTGDSLSCSCNNHLASRTTSCVNAYADGMLLLE